MLGLALLALTCAGAAHADSIEGVVREAGTRRPVPFATVSIAGTPLHTTTDEEGDFVLAWEGKAGEVSVTLDVDTAGYAHTTQVIALRTDRSTTAVTLYVAAQEVGETRVRERRSRENISRGAHRISDTEVNELPGTYGDPAKAIENFPGMGRVVLSQGSLLVRGARANESNVFVDDYEVPDLYHYTGSTSVINIPFVDSVELVPGAFSARYGRSTGGIITLRTKKLPTDDVHGFAKLDVIDGGAYVGLPIADNIAVGASARRSYLDAIRQIQRAQGGTGDALLLIPTYWDYQLKLDWDTAPGHEMVVFAFGSGDREEYVSDGRGALDPYLRTNDSDFHRLSLRYQHNLGGGFTNTMTPVIGYQRSTLNEQGGLRFRDQQTFEAQLREELVWKSGTTRVISGVDLTLRSDAFLYRGLLASSDVRELPPVDLESVASSLPRQADTWRVTAAAYVEGTMEPMPHVTLTPGARFEAYVLEGDAYYMLEPRFAGAWQVTTGDFGTLLRTSAGTSSRPPDPDDLAAARHAGVFLGPQQALSIQGGLEQSIGDRLTLSSTLFSVWRDELTTRTDTFPVPARFGATPVVAGGSGFATGAEFLARIGVPKHYFAWLTYTVMRSERRDGPAPFAAPYPYAADGDTTHLLGALAQVYLPAGFRVGGRYRVATGMPRHDVIGGLFDADTGRFIPQPAPKGQTRFPVFQSLDVRVDWSTVLDWFELDVYADLVNVLNLRAEEDTYFNFDYTQSEPHLGLPTVPAIGAKATF